jgi:hypothetical protein
MVNRFLVSLVSTARASDFDFADVESLAARIASRIEEHL